MQLPKKLAKSLVYATALASLLGPVSCAQDEPLPTTTAEVQIIEDVHYNLVSSLYAEPKYNLHEHIPEYYINDHILECSYKDNDYLIVGSTVDYYGNEWARYDKVFFFKVNDDKLTKLYEWKVSAGSRGPHQDDTLRIKEIDIDIPEGKREPMVLVYAASKNKKVSEFNILYECPLTMPNSDKENFTCNINRPWFDLTDCTDLRGEQEEGFKVATEIFLISQSSLSENEKKEAMQNAARNLTDREMDERTLYVIGFLYGGDTAKVMETYYETGELDEEAYEGVMISLGIRAVMGPSAGIGEWVVGNTINYFATEAGQQFLHRNFPVELYKPEYDKEYGGVGRIIGELLIDLGKVHENFDANSFARDLTYKLYDMGVDATNLCQDLGDFAANLQGSFDDFEIPEGLVEDMQKMIGDVASDLGRDIEKGIGDISKGVGDAIGDLFK